MRELVIRRLADMVNDSKEYGGIPRYFDCDDSENIVDAAELLAMTDEQLLECFEACVGFGG